MPRNYYDVLGVSRSANTREIKRAFRRLAKQYHPDVSQSSDAEQRFKEIYSAYEVLSDERKRAQYDHRKGVGNNVEGAGRASRRNEKGKQNSYAESKNSRAKKQRTNTSSEHGNAKTPRTQKVSYDSTDYVGDAERLSYVKIGCGLAFVGVVILFAVSPNIASFFLSISRAANHSAHNEVLVSFLDPRPTYTPLPTQTPLPTYTPLPTLTPRPTYTPYPTPTPITAAFIIQQLESQAQLVVVQNEIGMREFNLGVEDGLCSHGGVFNVHGVIEAGIDFATIDENSVSYNSDEESYSLQLPAPEYTSCRIEYIRLKENSFSLCNPDWDRARIFAEVQAMMQFIKETEEDGLLLEAEEHSEEILEDFVHILTGKPVNVVFRAMTGRPKMSESCAPDIPGGWYHDISSNVWKKSETDN